MYFINPYFLLAGLFIVIPIIIHLFNFRKYRKIYFSNVEFLREIKSQSQKSSVLRHLLVLFCRILAILCLVLAFSQPYIPLSNNKKVVQKNNLVSIYVDNSFSMDAISSNGRLIEEAKNKATDICSVYKTSDLFQILTNDFEGKHQRLVNTDEFKDLLNEVKTTSISRSLSEIASRQKDMLTSNTSKSKSAYIISDFQQSICDFEKLTSINNQLSAINYYLIPVYPGKKDNIYIDSIWFDSPVMLPDQKLKLNARIINSGDNDIEKIPVKLTVSNKQRAIASVSVNANSHTDISMPYTISETGINSCMLEITDYPITFDNTFYFSYNVSPKLSVASINAKDENKYLNSLFGKDSLFTLTNYSANSIDYSSFKNYTLIILNGLNNIPSGLSQEITRYMNNGGNIIIFPGDNIDMQSYQSFLKPAGIAYYIAKDTVNTKVSEININNPLYNDVFEKIPENADLPKVFSHYIINVYTHSLSESLLKLQNNNNFLTVQPLGKGKIYLFASPLDSKYSNFPRHSLFVPTMYKIALMSENNPKLYYTIGKDEKVSIKNYSESGENVIKIKKVTGDFEIIPEYSNNGFENSIFIHDQIKEAGNYLVYSNDKPVQTVSLNYDRRESEMKYYIASQLENMISKAGLKNFTVIDVKNKPLSKALTEMNLGIRLWKIFVILALLFIATEVLILRFVKK